MRETGGQKQATARYFVVQRITLTSTQCKELPTLSILPPFTETRKGFVNCCKEESWNLKYDMYGRGLGPPSITSLRQQHIQKGQRAWNNALVLKDFHLPKLLLSADLFKSASYSPLTSVLDPLSFHIIGVYNSGFFIDHFLGSKV